MTETIFVIFSELHHEKEKGVKHLKNQVAQRRKRHYEPDEANWRDNSWSEVQSSF